MKTIYKYKIEPSLYKQKIMMPAGARCRSVGIDTYGDICIWAEVETDSVLEARTFWCVGTGWDLTQVFAPQQQFLHFLGTVFIDYQMVNASSGYREVYHIYETEEYTNSFA